MKILLLICLILWGEIAGATEPFGQKILDETFVANGVVKTDTWINRTGVVVYIHSAEMHMICPVDNQWNVAWLTRISDESQVLHGGLYYPEESPYLVSKNFCPDYVSLQPGDGLQLKFGAGFPNLRAPFRDYVLIWYSRGMP